MNTMLYKTINFLCLLFTALALVPTMAHLLELPNKIYLSKDDYLIVQQIYRGWALLGIVTIGAFISNLILTILTRKEPKVFKYNLITFLCISAAVIIFFVFTYPANKETANWTFLPENWQKLRTQWEYSHAAGSLLYLAAFIALSLSIFIKKNPAYGNHY